MMTPEQLLFWRKAKNWSQEQAAEALGYKRRGYQALESGARPITLTIELAIAGLEVVSVAYVQCMANTTAGGLDDEDKVKDLAHEFERSYTNAALSRWARKWGRAAINRLLEVAE